jgi:hypothetical protein
MSKSNTPTAGQSGFQKTHGLRRSPEYNVWNGMKHRCHNPNYSGYYKYGARGIVVCQEWRDSFEAFYRDMGPRPSPRHSVERDDNDGPYAPWNCRWATTKEQAYNKRRTIRVEGKTIGEIATEAGLDIATIRARYYRGLDAESIGSADHLKRKDLGTLNKGSTNGQAKLTEEDVRAIRTKRNAGTMMKDIAAEYRVSRALISAICTGKRWSWLT